MASRSAKTEGAGIALTATKQVGFRTFFFVCSRRDEHNGGQIPGPEQTVARMAPLKRRSTYPSPSQLLVSRQCGSYPVALHTWSHGPETGLEVINGDLLEEDFWGGIASGLPVNYSEPKDQ